MAFFEPDKFFMRISHIDIERDLLSLGLKHALLDIDNTILTRDTRELPRDVAVWLGRARDAGITFCLVSNSTQEQTMQELSERLDIPVVLRSMKPLPQGYLRGMRILGGTKEDTVMIGDQMATDIVGAHLVGMKAYMVAPLVGVDLPHTVILRWMERVMLGDQTPEPLTPATQQMLDEA
ncbi:MAG: YqeG family HAD IIIA-type phosphatase [Eggerthellaceae bacterium]|nr:YqeG family HAD IIIA-type phosphatase [Eggerthellaceae bacterium]